MPVEPPIEVPRTLAAAYAILAGAPHRPIAGGTDLMVQITGELGQPPERMLDLWRLDELRGITLEAGGVVLGALTTYTDIRRSAICREHLPALVEAAATIGAAQIQNRGTLGGNIANASPAGDTLPGPAGDRRGDRGRAALAASATIAAAVDFWPAYRKTALDPDELLLRVRIPLAGGREVALPEGRDAAGPGDQQGRASRSPGGSTAGPPSGGRAGRPRLGRRDADPGGATEAALEGAHPTPETADRAAETLADEIHPIDDVRSTADYRRAVAARVLHRLIRDAGGW